MHSGGGGGGGKASASREPTSPPRMPFATHQGANAPHAAPAAHLPLFDRLRAARDSAGDQHLQRVQSLRHQKEVQHEQKEVQTGAKNQTLGPPGWRARSNSLA